MSVKVVRDRSGEILKAIRALTKNQVLIGIPAEASDRQPEPGEAEPLNNALIGYLMEHGEPAQNLPARPHLIPGVEEVRDRMVAQLRKAGEGALSGDLDAISRGQHAAGLIGQNAVRAKITDGGFAPLSERTLARRKAKGRTGDKPLIDTGQYRRAQTYVIREKGK